jgi:hypothetical protein
MLMLKKSLIRNNLLKAYFGTFCNAILNHHRVDCLVLQCHPYGYCSMNKHNYSFSLHLLCQQFLPSYTCELVQQPLNHLCDPLLSGSHHQKKSVWECHKMLLCLLQCALVAGCTLLWTVFSHTLSHRTLAALSEGLLFRDLPL